MKCPVCDTRNAMGNKFCRECGTRLASQKEDAQGETQRLVSAACEDFSGLLENKDPLEHVKALRQLEDLESAISLCKKITEEQPLNREAHSLLSSLYAQDGDLELSIKYREIAHELTPTTSETVDLDASEPEEGKGVVFPKERFQWLQRVPEFLIAHKPLALGATLALVFLIGLIWAISSLSHREASIETVRQPQQERSSDKFPSIQPPRSSTSSPFISLDEATRETIERIHGPAKEVDRGPLPARTPSPEESVEVAELPPAEATPKLEPGFIEVEVPPPFLGEYGPSPPTPLLEEPWAGAWMRGPTRPRKPQPAPKSETARIEFIRQPEVEGTTEASSPPASSPPKSGVEVRLPKPKTHPTTPKPTLAPSTNYLSVARSHQALGQKYRRENRLEAAREQFRTAIAACHSAIEAGELRAEALNITSACEAALRSLKF